MSLRKATLALAATAAMFSAGCATYGDFTLTSLDGQSVSLAEQKGKVVLLTFWGST